MSETATADLSVVGKAHARVEGPLKVSGVADYAADRDFPGLLHAVPVGATIASGRIKTIETDRARQMPGVRAVFTRGDLPPMSRVTGDMAEQTKVDEKRPPLDDDEVRYYGQFIALVVADTLEQAKAAAEAVSADYEARTPAIDPQLVADKPEVVHERGDAACAFDAAPVKVDAAYAIAPEVHNPIETHATVAVWEDETLTLYESTQAVVNHRNVLADMLGLPRERVRVVSRFIGSGFGGKLWPWTQSPLAAGAAMVLGRPIKLVLSRPMMFHAVGHRPRIQQRVRLGADPDGRLMSIQHDYVNETSILDDYTEHCGEATAHLYRSPNLRVTGGLAHRNVGTPTSMRGPGAVPGLFATESALDELALALRMDPVELRLANDIDVDQRYGVPFSSRHLKECLTTGAERFGWARRDPAIGAMSKDGEVLGWGVAACTWQGARLGCSASIDLREDGSARVTTASQDIGTGTYTVAALIAAELLGLQTDQVEVALGDTRLPAGAISGGSMLTASLVEPISAAVEAAGKALIKAAISGKDNPFSGADAEDLAFENGRVARKGGNAPALRFDELLRMLKLGRVNGSGSGEGTFGQKSKPKVSTQSFGAHFVEVAWRPQIARLRVSRVVTVIDGGRIINPLAARNQIEGAVVMGIGMALFEGAEYDHRSGAPMNANLADYVVATHADVPDLDVCFLDYPDLELNRLGARGVGEIGLAGTAAAITNAVHHATGVRIRSLPLRIEDLLAAA